MTKLDNVVAAIETKRKLEELRQLASHIDDTVNGREGAQAERFKQLHEALDSILNRLEKAINAIPKTDLTPISSAIKSYDASVKAIKFPEVKFPPPTNLTPVLQQIDGLSLRMDGLAKKIDAFHVDMPEITVNTPQQQVEAPEPTKWVHKVIRGPNGSIREIVSTAE